MFGQTARKKYTLFLILILNICAISIFFDHDQVLSSPQNLAQYVEAVMGNDTEFKEEFNWLYFFGILAALVAFPLLHIIAWVVRMVTL
ncbi:MAG: hypothetical protein WA981_01830 [Glaciecola sp.]